MKKIPVAIFYWYSLFPFQIKLPRMLQGVIAAFGDLYLYKLSALLTGRATAQWTLLCQTLSWFMLYCSTRTLTNSTETVLCTIALYYFPWPGKSARYVSVLFILCDWYFVLSAVFYFGKLTVSVLLWLSDMEQDSGYLIYHNNFMPILTVLVLKFEQVQYCGHLSNTDQIHLRGCDILFVSILFAYACLAKYLVLMW